MKDVENSKKMEIMKNSFPGFLYRGYQDVIDGLTRQKILANEHYNKTITFEIKPYNYYSNTSGKLQPESQVLVHRCLFVYPD